MKRYIHIGPTENLYLSGLKNITAMLFYASGSVHPHCTPASKGVVMHSSSSYLLIHSVTESCHASTIPA